LHDADAADDAITPMIYLLPPLLILRFLYFSPDTPLPTFRFHYDDFLR